MRKIDQWNDIYLANIYCDDWLEVICSQMGHWSHYDRQQPYIWSSAVSRQDLIDDGWTDLPYGDDHRVLMINDYWQPTSPTDVGRAIWSRLPATEDCAAIDLWRDDRMWVPVPCGSFYGGPGEEYRDGLLTCACAVIPGASHGWIWPSRAFVDPYGMQWEITTWELKDNDVIIASAVGVGLTDYNNQQRWILPDEIPLISEETAMAIICPDVQRLSALLERLLAQKLIVSINNGRVRLEWPSGETQEDNR